MALGGADAGNYTLNVPTFNANITAAPLTVTGITAAFKVYDGTTNATINMSNASLVGLVATDIGNVTLLSTGTTGSFADANVGTGKVVSIGGLTLIGSAAGNYILTQPTATANITSAGLTVTGITAASKVYDGTMNATIDTSSGSLNGVLPGDAANVTLVTTGATATFADAKVGTSKLVNISALTLSGSAAGNYTLTQPTATANITSAGLTVTGVTAASKVYDDTMNATINTSSASLNGYYLAMRSM